MTPIEIAALVVFVAPFAIWYAYGLYTLLTMPPDDERWDIVGEAMEMERRRRWRRL